MKANRIHRFGPPEAIVFEDIDKPKPGEGEVLVAVKASGVRALGYVDTHRDEQDRSAFAADARL